MRYAIFTDIHANLEALEAVLAKIDELSQQEPIDGIWFLGDLVGYGPNPNECIQMLRERTDVIIAGNHDWAAVGKLDLEDFSEAARISAEWTATQLTEENRTFLANLPERIEKNECILVHGSPYGPLWEYLTSEVLAERSFQHFSSRFCFVGHTHVPVIFQQPDTVANSPTLPLEVGDMLTALPEQEAEETTQNDEVVESRLDDDESPLDEDELLLDEDQDDETTSLKAISPSMLNNQTGQQADREYTEAEQIQNLVANAADAVADLQHQIADDAPEVQITVPTDMKEIVTVSELQESQADVTTSEAAENVEDHAVAEETTSEETIQNAEERLNQEIEELLTLLGLSQSMIDVTNEMLIPPEGEWQAPEGYRAIVNPGGVGQPRDGDPRAAFMIYDTNHGFHFYRIPYSFEKTQEKIIKVKLPQYLATRLAYGR
jgi:diadenosine tetraphosphatase ApaH/serine/threonine PP2A family protein phosphatase